MAKEELEKNIKFLMAEKVRRQKRTAYYYVPDNQERPDNYVPIKSPEQETACMKIHFSKKDSSPPCGTEDARKASTDRRPIR